MNIGLIGSGGREHALCQKLFKSRSSKKIFCFPGNAGTADLATNIDVDILNFNKIYKLIKIHKIDVVIVGPEEPLVKGLVDFLNKKKVKVFGPNKYASKLEGSKAFMKNLCKANKIPTANFKICRSLNHIKNFLKISKFPIVVKNLINSIVKDCEIKNYKELKTFKGSDFKGAICNHPFLNMKFDYDVPMLDAQFVNLEQGTGIVHCAPSHGPQKKSFVFRAMLAPQI